MAEGKKPGAITAAGVIELVFSILIFIFAITGMVVGCTSSLAGIAGAASGGSMTDEKTVAAATGAGIMAGITVIISLVAIVFGVIGIIGASNLFKGKKAGRSLSNVWAIALIIIFLIGLIPSIVSIMNMGATTAGLQSLTTDSTANIGTAEVQAAVSSLPIIMIVLSAIFYLLPAILVFILLKGKAVKDFFAATQA